MHKKSQISIYIILGIVIVLLVSIMLYIRALQVEVAAPGAVAEEIPLEARPFKMAMEDCLRKVSHEAFDLVGQHGGYLDPLNPGLSGREFFFDQQDPTESDGVTIFNEFMAVPFWMYVKEPNPGLTKTISDEYMPSLTQINNQVSLYILTTMRECMDNYRAFNLQGFNVTEQPGKFVMIDYLEDSMVMDLTYPIELRWGEDGEIVTRITKYSAELPFNFVEFYFLASLIANRLFVNQSLEDATMHTIALYSGREKDKMPPFSSDEVVSSQKVEWSISEQKDKMKDLLFSSVPLFQVAGMKSSEQIKPEGHPGVMKPYYFDIVDESDLTKKMDVDFIYLYWPFYFDIKPASGDKLGPQVIQGPDFFDIITGAKTFRYRFFYDISYPVLIRVTRNDIPFRSGDSTYSFYFAYEVNIRRNVNLMDYLTGKGRMPLNPDDVELSQDEIQAQVEAEAEDQGFEVQTAKAEESLICNPNQRISERMKFIVYDQFTEEPIEGAQLSFTCGRYKTCKWDDLFTKENLATGLATLETSLPMCKGEAYAVFDKEGYLRKRVRVETDWTNELTYEVPMIPKFIVNITGVLVRQSWNLSNRRELKDGEFATIRLERVLEDDPNGEMVSYSTIIRPGQEFNRELVLAPGRWKVEGKLISEDSFFIDATRRCDCDRDETLREICERGNKTLRTNLPEGCRIEDALDDNNEPVKVCTCVNETDLHDCNEIKDEQLFYYGNKTSAQCKVVQDYVEDFTEVGPNAEIGGAYLIGENNSMYWELDYNQLYYSDQISFRLIEFPMPEKDTEIGKLNIRDAFKELGMYSFYSEPVLS